MNELVEVKLSARQWRDVLRVLKSNLRWKNLREEETVGSAVSMIERYIEVAAER
ncbi:hypothetical protein ACOTTU_19915 [Roseobacter sp. EG26]|uniref:hypothetical protein n=1 Tax=Roseobacter sp. EG26 TaxID=3412477 RepID=UPI003CE4DAC3